MDTRGGWHVVGRDAQLELMGECSLDSRDLLAAVGIEHVAVDDHGTVLVQLAGATDDGSQRVMVARVDGLLD